MPCSFPLRTQRGTRHVFPPAPCSAPGFLPRLRALCPDEGSSGNWKARGSGPDPQCTLTHKVRLRRPSPGPSHGSSRPGTSSCATTAGLGGTCHGHADALGTPTATVCTSSLAPPHSWNGPAPTCWPHLTLRSGQGVGLSCVPSLATNHLKSLFLTLQDEVLDTENWVGGGQGNKNNNSR